MELSAGTAGTGNPRGRFHSNAPLRATAGGLRSLRTVLVARPSRVVHTTVATATTAACRRVIELPGSAMGRGERHRGGLLSEAGAFLDPAFERVDRRRVDDGGFGAARGD